MNTHKHILITKQLYDFTSSLIAEPSEARHFNYGIWIDVASTGICVIEYL